MHLLSCTHINKFELASLFENFRLILLGFLIEQSVHGGVVNHITEPCYERQTYRKERIPGAERQGKGVGGLLAGNASLPKPRQCWLGRQEKTQPVRVGFLNWWARRDLNPGPKDSGLCDFRHSLDYAFTVAFALGGCRLVSTPSTMLSHRSLARRCRMRCRT